ncbi:hypothetical protein ABEB36_013143 [Hypothenemus hampei]|uniref:Kinesin motor domain-containing protein n=1 Tax=Hypothenemus hampei TaxID=57062 RepID=A0ABD1E775_HYPHA
MCETSAPKLSMDENPSFLRARDPSIISWNMYRNGLKNARHNLANDFSDVTFISGSDTQKQDNYLEVFLRIRGDVPLNNLYTVENNMLYCVLPEGSQAARNNRDKAQLVKKFEFSHIFDVHTKQNNIFDLVIKERILSFINGHNSTIMVYGVSGSGKTYTMVGTAEEPGIIPRAIDYFFRTIKIKSNKLPCFKPLPNGKVIPLGSQDRLAEVAYLYSLLEQTNGLYNAGIFREMERRLSLNEVAIVDQLSPITEIWVGFVEIYNERIYDLLEPIESNNEQRTQLSIGGATNKYIRNQKYVYVRTALEAYQVLQFGIQRLSYAATAINQHSSRAHSIFSVRLITGYNSENCKISIFNFCDLAGSERMNKTFNRGDRLKESTKINTSLLVLNRCINCIREKQQNKKNSSMAPFRDSKLTQLFQEALEGKENIIMMVNINPSPNMFDDTLGALQFSAIAQQIVCKDMSIMEDRNNGPNQLSTSDSQDDIHKLREELELQKLYFAEFQEKAELALTMETNHIKKNLNEVIHIKDLAIERLENKVKELENIIRKMKMENSNNSIVEISSSEDDDSY